MSGPAKLALCSVEKFPFFFFWQKVRFIGLNLDSSGIKDALAQYDPQDFFGFTQLQLLTVNYAYRCAFETVHGGGVTDEEYEWMILKTIDFGTDVQQGCNGHTPLMQYLSVFVVIWNRFDRNLRPLPKMLRKALFSWLRILLCAGIDLCAYGEGESRLFQSFRGLLDPVPPLQHWPQLGRDHDQCFHFQLVYGSTPSDWDVTLLDFTEECAGDFWQLVDAQTEDAERKLDSLPGSWVDS